jgi:cytochrome c oxidase subunit 2
MKNVIQSALDGAGVQALRIENLWWLMFWVSVAVWVLVIGYVALAVRRASRIPGDHTVVEPGSDARRLRAVAIATGVTVLTLFGLLTASVVTGRAVASQRDETGLVIKVKAAQWWWDIEYQHPDPSQRVRTSNELHLPLGRTAAINLTGNDVVHSFWVPSLHGKMDVIPGHEAYLWLRADTLGTFRGQCAEFCGVQHAHMAFTVIVESSDDFERWIQAQRVTALPPASPEAARGQAIVQQGACALCHQILGTSAGGRIGPDLTHIASRQTIGAGTLPMSRANLLAWIDDPQRFKPGIRMPKVGLSRDDLIAVVAYLEGLR